MADLTITPANVSPGTNATTVKGTAFEALTAGQLVYRRASDGKFGATDNNSGTAEIRVPHGIAIGNAAANQGVVVLTAGRINIGAVVVVGTPYFSSGTPGLISNIQTDATSGKWPAFIGFAVATTTIDVAIKFAGVAVP